MGEFAFSIAQASESQLLFLKGSIDEDARLELIDLNPYKSVTVDLEGVTQINSIGIRSWMDWVTFAAAGRTLIFRRCPRSIVSQINIVKGFIPEKARIESFFVPYTCDDCDYVKEVLFEIKNFDAKPPLSIPCGNCDQDMEIAIHPKKYLQFLDSLNAS